MEMGRLDCKSKRVSRYGEIVEQRERREKKQAELRDCRKEGNCKTPNLEDVIRWDVFAEGGITAWKGRPGAANR